jgi:hypothetical protein
VRIPLVPLLVPSTAGYAIKRLIGQPGGGHRRCRYRAAMLFPQRFWAGLADRSVDLAFRRWRRAGVKAGGTQLTPAGVLAIDAVDVVDIGDITEDEVRRAGYRDRGELLAELDRHREGALYRIAFHHAGADPRVALREDVDVPEDEMARIRARLARLDRASSHGPWTQTVLRMIAAQPAVRAGDLAASLGRETQPFKTDVRKLKRLGLTESLAIGYRLSPRGRAVLDRL